MSTSTVLKEAARREVNSEKKREVAYVRAEKAADDAAQQRLIDAYGDSRRIGGDPGRRTRGWRCVGLVGGRECGYVNYESRMVCGECLAPNRSMARLMAAGSNAARPPQCLDPSATIVEASGRYYRSFCGAAPAPAPARPPGSAEASLVTGADRENGSCGECDDGDECERITFDTDANMYELHMSVARRFLKLLIGGSGAVLQETQRMTGATVVISGDGDEVDGASKAPLLSSSAAAGAERLADDAIVTIRAEQAANVRAAQLRVETAIEECRNAADYTHFLSVPLGTIPSATVRLSSFITDMQDSCCDEHRCVDRSLFQKPSRVHLTLLMLRLHSKEEINAAHAVFESFGPVLEHVFSRDDAISLKGLNCMNDDPSAVHVVYLEVERDATFTKLRGLVTQINTAFTDAGIASRRDVAHNDKLHATVMNSKWRTDATGAVSQAHGAPGGGCGAAPLPKGPRGPRIAFDATAVFKLFGKADLGAHRLERVEMNVLGTHPAANGYYPNVAVINFPEPLR